MQLMLGILVKSDALKANIHFTSCFYFKKIYTVKLKEPSSRLEGLSLKLKEQGGKGFDIIWSL